MAVRTEPQLKYRIGDLSSTVTGSLVYRIASSSSVQDYQEVIRQHSGFRSSRKRCVVKLGEKTKQNKTGKIKPPTIRTADFSPLGLGRVIKKIVRLTKQRVLPDSIRTVILFLIGRAMATGGGEDPFKPSQNKESKPPHPPVTGKPASVYKV
ncbi:bcl-2 homologous antagonist/killer-like [Huso huso]|uniref:Bcl-2 homologous antagonist/killer-like n=1 Tax=Huso huso TaxID=61971 RepID=A0ABR0YHA3_HUSHU